MEYGGYCYLLASKGRKLYCGVTSELMLRVRQHKAKVHPEAHTARFNIDRLVWYQGYGRIEEAIGRETEIKGLNRVKKIALIVAVNPEWKDLSAGWGLPAEVKRIAPMGFGWEE